MAKKERKKYSKSKLKPQTSFGAKVVLTVKAKQIATAFKLKCCRIVFNGNQAFTSFFEVVQAAQRCFGAIIFRCKGTGKDIFDMYLEILTNLTFVKVAKTLPKR